MTTQANITKLGLFHGVGVKTTGASVNLCTQGFPSTYDRSSTLAISYRCQCSYENKLEETITSYTYVYSIYSIVFYSVSSILIFHDFIERFFYITTTPLQ